MVNNKIIQNTKRNKYIRPIANIALQFLLPLQFQKHSLEPEWTSLHPLTSRRQTLKIRLHHADDELEDLQG